MSIAVHLTDSASRLNGGLFESVRGLCRGLTTTTAWEASVVAGDDAFLAEDRSCWAGVPLHIAPRSPLGRFGAAAGMVRIVRETSPQVLHLNGLWGPASVAADFLTRGRRLPLIISPHGMLEPWAMRRSRIRKSLALGVWTTRLLARTDCFHALCEAERNSLRKFAPNQPIAIIPNGVHRPATLTEEPPVDKTVLFLGRIHPKKGLRALLSAWSTLEAVRSAGWILTIAGWDDGGHEAELKALAANLGLGETVKFIGPMFGADKDSLLRAASVCVLPSFSEGLPMAILEAWSYGKPVLMTAECHLACGFEMGAAVECDPTPQSIAVGLTKLLAGMDEPARREMGARGSNLIDERFTWNYVSAEMGEVYSWLNGDTPMPRCVDGGT
jgi:glycosyltransferase involved in cell wall biosynthesis